MEVKPYWILVAGLVVLLLFVIMIRLPRHRRLGPGGTQHRRSSPWLGPGGTERHHLLGSFFGSNTYARISEGFASVGGGATFTMFGVDWCPHCVKAKPLFESLGPTTTIGGQSVTCRYVNPESDKAAAKGFEIEGYPTFYLEKAGKKIKYGGPRTAEGFHAFLESELSA